MSRCAKGKKDDIIKEERDSVIGEEDDFTQALKQVDKKKSVIPNVCVSVDK